MLSNTNKPQLVLLHGWGLSSYVWAPLQAQLSQSFNLTCLDLPGYGHNQSNPTPQKLNDLASWLATEIPDDSILVAWSMGGHIALHAAIHHPEKLQHLVLLGTNPKFIQDQNWPGVRSSVWQRFEESAKRLPVQKLLERFLAIQALGSQSAKADIQGLQARMKQAPLPSKEVLLTGLGLLSKSDYRTDLARLNVPCTLIVGESDSLAPLDALQKAKQLNNKIELEVIHGASHAPFASHPDHFVQLLLNLRN